MNLFYKIFTDGARTAGDNPPNISELPAEIQDAWKVLDDYYSPLIRSALS